MEDRAKEIFEEALKKQAKLAKKTILITFGIIGLLFIVLGIAFMCSADELSKELGITFLGSGGFMAVLGLILFFAIPTKYNYEKYKMRAKKYGAMNVYVLNAKIAELEARVEELERNRF